MVPKRRVSEEEKISVAIGALWRGCRRGECLSAGRRVPRKLRIMPIFCSFDKGLRRWVGSARRGRRGTGAAPTWERWGGEGRGGERIGRVRGVTARVVRQGGAGRGVLRGCGCAVGESRRGSGADLGAGERLRIPGDGGTVGAVGRGACVCLRACARVCVLVPACACASRACGRMRWGRPGSGGQRPTGERCRPADLPTCRPGERPTATGDGARCDTLRRRDVVCVVPIGYNGRHMGL